MRNSLNKSKTTTITPLDQLREVLTVYMLFRLLSRAAVLSDFPLMYLSFREAECHVGTTTGNARDHLICVTGKQDNLRKSFVGLIISHK